MDTNRFSLLGMFGSEAVAISKPSDTHPEKCLGLVRA